MWHSGVAACCSERVTSGKLLENFPNNIDASRPPGGIFLHPAAASALTSEAP